MEGVCVRPTNTEENTPVTGKSVRPEPGEHHPVNEPMKTPGRMRVRVKGIEVTDMRSYLAKKKQERDQRDKGDKKNRNKADHKAIDLQSPYNHGDQHQGGPFLNQKTATGVRKIGETKKNGDSDEKGEPKKYIKIFGKMEGRAKSKSNNKVGQN